MTDTVENPETVDDMPAPQVDPRELARAVALSVAEESGQVGEVVDAIPCDDGVTDFRLAAHVKGYEGWQWSVTLYHDDQTGAWTVNESSLIPTDDALMPPPWIPWKDRLEPTDLAPTDSIGTDPDDPRLEDGFRRTDPVEAGDDGIAGTDAADETAADDGGDERDESEDVDEAVEEFDLSRRHVMSPLGRSQTAKRWYEGPRGPKALSTKTASGNLCSTCGFLVPLKGELNLLFGVCANKWSPDDGRVVSLDHGCGEHSEIAPPEPGRLWVQSKPAFDDLHIDIVEQRPREERAQIELLEQENDEETATEEDIAENTQIDADGEDVAANTVDPGEEPEVESVADLAATTQEPQNDADEPALDADGSDEDARDESGDESDAN